MNKILALGDIHGRTVWKDIIDKEEDVDHIVFIGDYVDSHYGVNPKVQSDNLKEIIKFKRDNEELVTLLIGNHDYHYLPHAVDHRIEYSNFQGHMVPDFKEQFSNAIKNNLMQACKIIDGIIFSHAGVTKTWCKDHGIDINDPNLELSINNEFKNNPKSFGFMINSDSIDGYVFPDPYGDDVFQSPFWVRPTSLHEDRIEKYRYVAGHTGVEQIKGLSGIVLIDALEDSKYLTIENRIFVPKQLE